MKSIRFFLLEYVVTICCLIICLLNRMNITHLLEHIEAASTLGELEIAYEASLGKK